MKKLLIYNGNVPEESIRDFAEKSVFRVSLAELADENFNNDVYCDNELSKCCTEEYDIIYITLNQSEYDYLAMEGLRIAHHIRLSSKYKNTRTPIVILCQENLEQILKLSKLGNILITPGTFLSSDLTLKEDIPLNKISDDQYRLYLSRTSIDPPGNYQSHHSIANEWALFRYATAFKEPIKESSLKHFDNLNFKLNSLAYLSTLHFKYHEVLYLRQPFKDRAKDKNATFKINGIEGKKIGLIEDEFLKGWEDFYSCIIEDSGAELISFTEFDKSLEKNELIAKIEKWLLLQVETENLCDLYIIDLRLHDDDFYEKSPEQMSGFLLSKYLKLKNPGIQILISTASDKLRNFQEFFNIGVHNFAVKESPETNFNRHETEYAIINLQSEIRKACSKSFLKEFYTEIDKIDKEHKFNGSLSDEEKEFKNKVFGKGGLLYDVFYFLNSKDAHMIYSSLMTCFIILEEYSSIYGVFDAGSWKIQDRGNDLQTVYLKDGHMHKISMKYGEYGDIMQEIKSTLIGVQFYEEQQIVKSELLPRKATDILKIAMVLHYRDGISMDKIDRLFKLKFIRNNTAHFGNLQTRFKMSPEEIEFFITKIFKKILT